MDRNKKLPYTVTNDGKGKSNIIGNTSTNDGKGNTTIGNTSTDPTIGNTARAIDKIGNTIPFAPSTRSATAATATTRRAATTRYLPEAASRATNTRNKNLRDTVTNDGKGKSKIIGNTSTDPTIGNIKGPFDKIGNNNIKGPFDKIGNSTNSINSNSGNSGNKTISF